jgi:uncharacterized alpha-E superfamily protein
VNALDQPILLCRTAESLYWAGRYLERAESLARLVLEHTVLLVDLPTSVPLTWEPLLAIPGAGHGFYARYEQADEASIMQFLLVDGGNRSSLRGSIALARENLRTVRQVFPGSAWRLVNELAAVVEDQAGTLWRRGPRHQLLERVIADSQRLAGVVAGGMRRDHAHEFFVVGTQLERADMTSRVLEVRAASLLAGVADGAAGLYDDVQWMGVLRSLVALHAYRRTTSERAIGPDVVRFLLGDERFPRSAAFCLDQVSEALRRLPKSTKAADACLEARVLLGAVPAMDWTASAIGRFADELQVAFQTVDAAVRESYFEPTP